MGKNMGNLVYSLSSVLVPADTIFELLVIKL